MPGRGTADAVFVLRRLTEKFRPKKRSCFCICWSGKAIDEVSKEVIRFALQQKGIPEYLGDGVMSLDKTAVSVDGEPSISFSVTVGVHQGSALSPFLFII